MHFLRLPLSLFLPILLRKLLPLSRLKYGRCKKVSVVGKDKRNYFAQERLYRSLRVSAKFLFVARGNFSLS